MKHPKRILAILLALALTLALALPAAAFSGNPVTIQPWEATIAPGESVTLTAQYDPEAITPGREQTYQWYSYQARGNTTTLLEGQAGPTLTIAPGDSWYPQFNAITGEKSLQYYCDVSNFHFATVTVKYTAWEKVYAVTVAPFVWALGDAAMLIWALPPTVIAAPLIYLGCVILRYVTGFQAAFA